MTETLPAKAPASRMAIIQVLVLLAASVLVFLPEMGAVVNVAAQDWEAAHLFAAPVLIMVLLYRRRHELARQLSRPSAWGLLVIILWACGCSPPGRSITAIHGGWRWCPPSPAWYSPWAAGAC